jgi:hypothetical protein
MSLSSAFVEEDGKRGEGEVDIEENELGEFGMIEDGEAVFAPEPNENEAR